MPTSPPALAVPLTITVAALFSTVLSVMLPTSPPALPEAVLTVVFVGSVVARVVSNSEVLRTSTFVTVVPSMAPASAPTSPAVRLTLKSISSRLLTLLPPVREANSPPEGMEILPEVSSTTTPVMLCAVAPTVSAPPSSSAATASTAMPSYVRDTAVIGASPPV